MTGYAHAEDLAELLGARKRGAGWMAKCPAHDDRIASLSISQGRKGTMLNCHAGCSTKEIAHAVGISMAQLFEDYTENGGHHTDVDLLLRDMVNRHTPPKIRFDSMTLSQVMDITLKLPDPDHAKGKARAHIAAGDMMELEFSEAYAMWSIVADTAVYAYLRDWYRERPERSWLDVRRAAMESMHKAWRKEMRD